MPEEVAVFAGEELLAAGAADAAVGTVGAEVAGGAVAGDLAAGAAAGDFAAGTAGAFDAAGVGTGVDAGIMASDAGLAATEAGLAGSIAPEVAATAGPTLGADVAGVGTLAPGSAGAFDASGVGTGIDAGVMSSDAGLAAQEATFAGPTSVATPSWNTGITPTDIVDQETGVQLESGGVKPESFAQELARTSKDSGLQGALDKLLKFGPLALGATGSLQGRQAARRNASQISQIGGPQRAVGQQLLSDFQSGSLNAADSQRIAEWEASAIAQARQFNARAGTSDSSQANTTEATIHKQAEAMREQARQNLLKTGLEALNVTDQFQLAAIQSEMQADTAASQQAMNFLSSYGSWLRALPQLTGQSQPATRAA